jgi:hypothetical protein
LAVVNVICTCECCSCECFIMFVEVINVCLPYYSCEWFLLFCSCECSTNILLFKYCSWKYYSTCCSCECFFHVAVVNVLSICCSCLWLVFHHAAIEIVLPIFWSCECPLCCEMWMLQLLMFLNMHLLGKFCSCEFFQICTCCESFINMMLSTHDSHTVVVNVLLTCCRLQLWMFFHAAVVNISRTICSCEFSQYAAVVKVVNVVSVIGNCIF